MRLYSFPGACSIASHIALLEGGLEFTVERVKFSGESITADGRPFADVNPKGMVPALEISPGTILTENIAVLQYIADQSPDSGLAPAAGSMDRYRLQEWLGFINSDFHRSYTIVFKTTAPNETTELFRKRIARYLDHIEDTLARRRFLLGDTFTIADCYLFTILTWSEPIGIDLSPWPSVEAYRATIADRDSVRAVTEWERHER